MSDYECGRKSVSNSDKLVPLSTVSGIHSCCFGKLSWESLTALPCPNICQSSALYCGHGKELQDYDRRSEQRQG